MKPFEKVMFVVLLLSLFFMSQSLYGLYKEQQRTILKQNARIIELTAFMNNQRNVDQDQQQQLNNHAEALQICLND